jgi:hypothetical protein
MTNAINAQAVPIATLASMLSASPAFVNAVAAALTAAIAALPTTDPGDGVSLWVNGGVISKSGTY